MNWSLMKNKLEPEEVIKLKLVGSNYTIIQKARSRIVLLDWLAGFALTSINLTSFLSLLEQRRVKFTSARERILGSTKRHTLAIYLQFTK